MHTSVPKIHRPACVITDIQDLEHLYTFKNFPIYMGCTDISNHDTDIFSDMDWAVSKGSGSLQLLNLLSPDILYKNSHGSGTVGKTWNHHHKKIYQLVSKYNYDNVLEIGGSSGSLVSHFLQEDKNFKWTIAEPCDIFNIKDKRVCLVNDYFENINFEKKFSTVIHSHVLEHIYDPLKFLQKIYDSLEDNGDHFISIPNMKFWLEQGFTNTLMFEHTYYIDINVLEYLLNKTNFIVVEKIVEEHSIFVHCKKSYNVYPNLPNLSYIKDLYLEYINKIETDTNNIINLVGGQKIFLFGAHIFSQILINLGLPENQIISVLDNDIKKQGKRLYGTNLFTQSPTCLSGYKDPIVVVRAGVYTKEIAESLYQLNPNTRII